MVELTDSPIDIVQCLTHVTHPECGAEVLFVGTTRRWTDGTETEYLEYDSYREMAIAQLRELESVARLRWPIHEVMIVHRLGRVAVKEPSVAVAVGSAHREAAFEAARWLIDELKRQVPIWKREHLTDQTSQWVHPSSTDCRSPAVNLPGQMPPAQPSAQQQAQQ